jgi:long-chain fatty acid transport protein
VTERKVVGGLAAGVLVLSSTLAHAGGLTLPILGVRATGRAGAFVAGADDPMALWYNPAGLVALGGKNRKTFLLDLAGIEHPVTYSRIDSGGNDVGTVENDPQNLPHPNLIGVWGLDSQWVLGVGLMTPYASLDGYPEDGPQRYQLVSMHNTMLAYMDAALGWKVSDKLWVGFGLSNLFVAFNSRVVFSSNPSETTGAPEDPEYDAEGELQDTSFFTPSGQAGIQYHPSPKWSMGASLRLPYFVRATGSVRVRLPSSGFFGDAHVEGESSDMSMTLPSIFRAAIEARPHPRFRAELGLDWEMWSQHDKIVLTPHDVRIEDQPGVGVYEVGQLDIPRHLKDTVALKLGVETQPLPMVPFDLRAGYIYETGAAPDEYLSLISPDSNKHMITFGAGLRIGRLRFDATFAHAFLEDRDIPLAGACLPQQNPIRTGDPEPPCDTSVQELPTPGYVYVNAGQYKSSWTVFGVGMSAGF